MKKTIVFLFIITLLFGGASFARAYSITDEFDDSSVIVVTKPAGNIISVFSRSQPFAGLGISEIKNLDRPSENGISLFGVQEAQTLKLTLENHGKENVLETIEKLNALPNVEFAEPNYIYHLLDTPNDPYYTNGRQYGLDLINAPAVWSMGIDCSDVVVAVLDSGVLMTHPDLKDNIWTNPGEAGELANNGIDDDGNGYIDDVHGWDFGDNDNNPTDISGHGTHVAGIVGAVTNNGMGVASLAGNVKIMPLKIFDKNGDSTFDYIYEAIKYADAMGASITNNSYGSYKESDALLKGVTESSQMLFVAAAGNDGKNNDIEPVYPASYDLDNVISVASVSDDDELSKFSDKQASNYGANSVDIAAPGNKIMSTYMSQGKAAYATLSGTSMACPMTVSAAAVIKAKYPDLTPAEIVARIKDNADVLDSLNGKVINGARLNAYAAVADKDEPSASVSPSPEAEQSPSPSPEVEPSPSPSPMAEQSPSPSPVAEQSPSPSPEADPEQSPVPSPSSNPENRVDIIPLENGQYKIDLHIPEAGSDNDVIIFAALQNNNVLKRVIVPEITNMSAVLTVPDSMADAKITLYIWSADMRPYMKPIYVTEESE